MRKVITVGGSLAMIFVLSCCGAGGSKRAKAQRRQLQAVSDSVKKAKEYLEGHSYNEARKLLREAYTNALNLRAEVLPSDTNLRKKVDNQIQTIEEERQKIASRDLGFALGNWNHAAGNVAKDVASDWTPRQPAPRMPANAVHPRKSNGTTEDPQDDGLMADGPNLVDEPLPGPPTGQGGPKPEQKPPEPEKLAEIWSSAEDLMKKHRAIEVYRVEVRGRAVAVWAQIVYKDAAVNRIGSIMADFLDVKGKMRIIGRQCFVNQEHDFVPNWQSIEDSQGKEVTAGSQQINRGKPFHFVVVASGGKNVARVVKAKVTVTTLNKPMKTYRGRGPKKKPAK